MNDDKWVLEAWAIGGGHAAKVTVTYDEKPNPNLTRRAEADASSIWKRWHGQNEARAWPDSLGHKVTPPRQAAP